MASKTVAQHTHAYVCAWLEVTFALLLPIFILSKTNFSIPSDDKKNLHKFTSL